MISLFQSLLFQRVNVLCHYFVIVRGKLRAVSKEAKRLVNTLRPQEVSNSLWAWGKLADCAILTDPAIVRVVSNRVKRAPGDLDTQQTANVLWAFAKLAEFCVERAAENGEEAAVDAFVDVAAVGLSLSLHSRVSDCLRGRFRLSSIAPRFDDCTKITW